MKKKIFIFLFLQQFLLLAYALDCPTKPIRLDKKYNLLVQDQDGLGTCFANSASLLLQAYDPEHRPVSYIYLAQSYFSNTVVVDNVSGDACEIVKRAKKKGACPREFSKLENAKFYSWDQAQILRELSNYWNSLSNFRNKGQLIDIALVRQYQPELFKLYKEAKEQYEFNSKFNYPYDNLKKNVIQQLALQDDVPEITKFRNIKLAEKYFEKNYENDLKNNEDFEKIIKSYLNYIFSSQEKRINDFLEKNKKTFKKAYDLDKKNYRNKNFDLIYEDLVKDYFHGFKEQKSCLSDNQKNYFKSIANLVNVYQKIHTKLDFEDFINVALAKNPNELVVGALMPECLEQNNLYKYKDDFDCVSESFPSVGIKVQEDGKLQYNLNKIFESGRNKILESLLDSKKPMPVSISICSQILKDSTVDSEFNVTEENCKNFNETAGSHAVTIVGVRKNTKTNKCEFLVQNSWGRYYCETTLKKRYDTENEKLPETLREQQKKVVDCEDNGNIWIPEDELLKNTSKISKIIKKSN